MDRTGLALTEPDPLEGCDLYLVQGGRFFRLRTALRLTAEGGRRSLLIRVLALVSLAWLPVVLGAILTGRAWSGAEEPLLRHFGGHARCLVAIPLLILGERVADRVLPGLLRYFVSSGVVGAKALPSYRGVLRESTALRCSTLWRRPKPGVRPPPPAAPEGACAR